MDTGKQWLAGCVNVAIAIACGAFGAHALKSKVAAGSTPEASLAVWQTAAQYHLWHALAILVVAVAMHTGIVRRHVTPFWGLWVGTVLFSGSLYAMVLTGEKGLGVITPVGGMVWMLNWLYLGSLVKGQPVA